MIAILLSLAVATPNADPRIDAIFAPYARTDAPGCAVGVYRSGEVVFTGAYGMADVANHVPIRDTTVFSIASTTKPFTALAVLLLEGDGKIRLDDDIRKYMPEVPVFGPPITVRDLLSHTSGLRDYWNLFNMAGWRTSDVQTEEDVLWLVKRQRALNHPTGTEFLYTNTGYILLATMVERVSGVPYRQFLSERIFRPLGMTRSDVKMTMGQVIDDFATGYWGHDPAELRVAPRPNAFAGNSGVVTTVVDLGRFAANFDEPKVGTKAMLDAMSVPGRLKDGTTFGYGLGLFIGTHRGHRMLSHAGSELGFKSDFIRFPDDDLTVAVDCNAFDIPPTPLALKVADLYLKDVEPTAGDSSSPTPAQGAPSIPTQDLAGLYWNGATGGIHRFLFKDGKLQLDGGGEGLFELAPLTGGAYRLTAAPRRYILTFTPGAVEEDVEGSRKRTFDKVPENGLKGAPLDALAGTYHSDELDVDWTFVLRSGELVLERRRMGSDPLKRLFGDVFQTETGYIVEFKRAAKGKPAGMEVITERVRRLGFTRRP
jgi:CubicO group peptidase (beta-lactamase class C family)